MCTFMFCLPHRLQQQHQGHKLPVSSPRDDTMSPSSSDRREHDNDIDEDDCISDLDSEISDPSHLEEIDPVSDGGGGPRRNSSSPTSSSSPPPNPLIINNPFLPPHLQLPVRVSSFELVRPPPPPPPPGMMLTPPSAVAHPSASSSSASSVNSCASDGNNTDIRHSNNNNNSNNINNNHSQQNHSASPQSPGPLQPPPNIPAPRPLFKPHELAASPDRNQPVSLVRPEQLGPRPLLQMSPGEQALHQQHSPPGAEFIKRDSAPHPAFPAHHDMLNQFAAARAEFLQREAAMSRELAVRERLGQGPGSIALHLPGGGVVSDFLPHHPGRLPARVDFSKAHELARQEFSSTANPAAGKVSQAHHDQFPQEATLPAFSRPNGVLGSAS